MKHNLKFTTLAFLGFCITSTLMGHGSYANAQTAEELKRYMEINKNQGKAAADIINSINGPARDPNIGVYTDQERIQLLMDALKVKKNDGGASRRQFEENFNRKNAQKQREREAAESYKREWIANERARQKTELDRGIARERAANAARQEQQKQINATNERRRQEYIAASIAKRDADEAEKKRRAEAHAATSRQRAQTTVSTGTNSGYADDGISIDDIPTIVVMPEREKKPEERTNKETIPEKRCACKGDDYADWTGIMCFTRSEQGQDSISYLSGHGGGEEYYPWTQQCTVAIDQYGRRISD